MVLAVSLLRLIAPGNISSQHNIKYLAVWNYMLEYQYQWKTLAKNYSRPSDRLHSPHKDKSGCVCHYWKVWATNCCKSSKVRLQNRPLCPLITSMLQIALLTSTEYEMSRSLEVNYFKNFYFLNFRKWRILIWGEVLFVWDCYEQEVVFKRENIINYGRERRDRGYLVWKKRSSGVHFHPLMSSMTLSFVFERTMENISTFEI